MFRSARLKLTLFYLAVLIGFSLTLSAAFRLFADAEYSHSNHDQNQAVRLLFIHRFYADGLAPPPSSSFSNVQADETSTWQQHLDRDLALINISALALGGLLSYWFAGRTLKPIETAHEAQKRFAADASHELRTPLTNLRLENEIFLRQKHFGEPAARELIGSNLEEVQRLQNLSNNLLDLTQYEHAALKRSTVGLSHAVHAAAAQTHKAAEARHVTIAETAEDATVLAHYDSFVQLLAILLDNAVKYGPEHAVVTIRGRRQSGRYVLQVVDEGPGIAPADLPHIFERLYRGDKARSSKVGGYGLGLSLAQEIARANHAQLFASNNVGGPGACFELHLETA